MRPLLPTLHRHHHPSTALPLLLRSFAHCKPQKPPPQPSPPTPPSPPKPPQKSATFTLHDVSWEDPYSWMSSLNDKVAMRHMDVYMEQEEKYTEAVMADSQRLVSKLQSEMASRFASDLSTPPLRWGPWYTHAHHIVCVYIYIFLYISIFYTPVRQLMVSYACAFS